MKLTPRLILSVIILMTSGALGFFISWYHNSVAIVPVPSEPQTLHYPTLFVDQLKGDPQAGEKIYTQYCSSCHNSQPVIDVKAPRMGDAQAWLKLRKLGVDTLLNTTISGKAAMPARGGCFECSDEQLQATIEYMLLQTQTPKTWK